ncbi:MAG TPA: sulfite exporter TauE/SafE family protein [Burkholderiales bacterium]|nr:sulfite exporter TauE/SafE family protein [Burkholderiales bacterium]
MEALLPAMLALGLASGLHCVGMCGGIVAAFSARRTIPIAPASRPRPLVLNAGRVATYAALGALAGALGGAVPLMQGALPAQTILFVLANAALILTGLYLAGAGRLLGRLEGLAAPLWRRVQPVATRLMATRTPLATFGAGMLWGLLPCALVYGALGAATLSGGAPGGALAMLAFGLGTLPWLLGAGAVAYRLRRGRVPAGLFVLGMGVFGLARSAELGEAVRAGLLCLVP